MESTPTVGTDGPAIMDTLRTITTEVVEDRPYRVAVVAADNIGTVTMTTRRANTGQNGATTPRPVTIAKTDPKRPPGWRPLFYGTGVFPCLSGWI
jgi:hypothetical protein